MQTYLFYKYKQTHTRNQQSPLRRVLKQQHLSNIPEHQLQINKNQLKTVGKNTNLYLKQNKKQQNCNKSDTETKKTHPNEQQLFEQRETTKFQAFPPPHTHCCPLPSHAAGVRCVVAQTKPENNSKLEKNQTEPRLRPNNRNTNHRVSSR